MSAHNERKILIFCLKLSSSNQNTFFKTAGGRCEFLEKWVADNLKYRTPEKVPDLPWSVVGKESVEDPTHFSREGGFMELGNAEPSLKLIVVFEVRRFLTYLSRRLPLLSVNDRCSRILVLHLLER